MRGNTVGQIATLFDPKRSILAAWIMIDGNNPKKVAEDIAKTKVDKCIRDFIVVRGRFGGRMIDREILVIVDVTSGDEFVPDQNAFNSFVSILRQRGHYSATYPEGSLYDPRAIYDSPNYGGWMPVRRRSR